MSEFDPNVEVMDWGTEEEELEKLKFKAYPAGDYEMQFESVEFKRSNEKQTPGLNFVFKVLGVEGRENVKQFHWCGWNTAFLRSVCTAIMRGEISRLREGFTLSGIMEGDMGPLEEYKGTTVKARVKLETYKDKATEDDVTNNKIAKFIYD